MEGSHRVIVSKPARPLTGGMFRQAASAAVSETKHDTPQAQAGGSEGGQERSDSVSWEEGQPRSSRCDSVLKEFLYWGAPRCQHCHSDGAHYLARRSRSDGLSLTALT